MRLGLTHVDLAKDNAGRIIEKIVQSTIGTNGYTGVQVDLTYDGDNENIQYEMNKITTDIVNQAGYKIKFDEEYLDTIWVDTNQINENAPEEFPLLLVFLGVLFISFVICITISTVTYYISQ